ncbi:PepSY domain-containing protein [Streptomyces lancefieldiae]|uniref:PepSY domain-containing protein n=1 Tax=Streptomyces lancefieldiae TaxID=3075520 RepID=A0ABU3AU50_9ACTN|nr:PepSY domain-containing protein [Streptomyces sp. DSM 40712]MDT0613718.1 PepSY domain-containing protein [Streptomyces sp. DSM 40712]
MKRNIVIAAVTAAALVGGGTATALANTGDDDAGATRQADDRDGAARVSSTKVTVADAVASALREAPGTAVSAELDAEDGDDGDDGERAAWEVDVLAGDGTWHSVWIDPADGRVLGSETDDEDDTDEVRAALKGTSVDAAEAARATAGHGTVTSVELDEDGHYGDGRAAWEVETRSSGEGEQDWRVDPKTGKVTADRSHDSDHSDSEDSDSDDD